MDGGEGKSLVERERAPAARRQRANRVVRRDFPQGVAAVDVHEEVGVGVGKEEIGNRKVRREAVPVARVDGALLVAPGDPQLRDAVSGRDEPRRDNYHEGEAGGTQLEPKALRDRPVKDGPEGLEEPPELGLRQVGAFVVPRGDVGVDLTGKQGLRVAQGVHFPPALRLGGRFVNGQRGPSVPSLVYSWPMRILVCVKHVPDLQLERSFTDGRMTRGADDGMNDLDEHAVEAAVRLVEEHGGEVVAVTVGGPDSVAAVRKALQLGANRAIRVTDEAIAGSDAFATARVLAAAARALDAEEPIDLVVTGMASLDGLTSMLPAALAAELGWPQLTLASSLAVDGGRARIDRHLPDAHETVEAALPAVVSVTDEANKPRYPNFKAIVAARSAEIGVWDLAALGLHASSVGAAGSRTRVLSATLRPARPNRRIVNDTGDGGAALAAFLVERGFA